MEENRNGAEPRAGTVDPRSTGAEIRVDGEGEECGTDEEEHAEVVYTGNYIAEYAYEAGDTDEVGLEEGDQLVDVRPAGDGWVRKTLSHNKCSLLNL